MNSVRIIGGKYRGKKITFPDKRSLRPTPDRVRETLFNWLMNDIRQANCLDVFGGSGALGFEAFSRGADKVTILESDLDSYKRIHQTAAEFDSNNLHVRHTDALNFLKNCSEVYDIIFLDPPFQSDLLAQCLDLIDKCNILCAGGLVYIEADHSVALPESFKKIKEKRAGNVYYSLWRTD